MPDPRRGPPSLDDVFLVFAQCTNARIDIVSWNAHAERFFATKIGLAQEKRYAPDAAAPRVDKAQFVVAPAGEEPGVRSGFARPREARDLALAEAADARAGAAGLALVARRCDTVWLVARDADEDVLALRLAALLASVLLGPILDCKAGELFGVKTARAKIEAMGALKN